MIPAGVWAANEHDDVISFEVRTPVYELTTAGVQVAGYAWDDVPGAPRLPYYARMIELPPTGTWELSYRSVGERTLAQRLTVAAVAVPDLPVPGPGNAASPEDLPQAVPTVDRPDPAIYGLDAFYPAAPVIAGAEQWQRGRRLLAVQVYPFQYNPVTREVRYHPEIEVTVRVEGMGDGGQESEVRGQKSEVRGQAAVNIAAVPEASGGAVRIRTVERGMYRLTRDDLLNAGVPADVDPRSFTMAYLGQTIRIQAPGEADGVFDSGDLVIFYAEPYVGRYMTQNVYWLYYGAAAAPASARMLARSTAATGAEPILTTITQTLHVEFDRIYPEYPNWPIPTDADHWFDSALTAHLPSPVAAVTYALALDDPLPAGQAQVRGLLYGGVNQALNPDQSVAVRLNDRAVRAEPYQWEGRTPYAFTATVPADWLDRNPSQLTLEAALAQLPSLTSYYIHPDWVEISYPAQADAEGDRIYIEGLPAAGAPQFALQVTGFTTAAVAAYDVRDPLSPTQITSLQTTNAGASYTATVLDAGQTYLLTTEAALRAPLAVELDDVTSWRTPGNEADYIAIVHPSLADAVTPLLAYRAGQGHRVATVYLQDIYDEFSYGRDYPPAIRDFLSYAYHTWNGGTGLPNPPNPPGYVLLVGDGHYDFKGGHTTLPNLIPPFMAPVDPFWGETAADNRFVSVDGPDDYMPDMAIGRIPARNPAEVTSVVEKILAYEDPLQAAPGPWQERVVFAAGSNDDPAGAFHDLSNDVQLNWLPSQYSTQQIYYGAGYNTSVELRAGIRSAFDNSALLMQWFGHGAGSFWGRSGQSAWVVNWYTPGDPETLQPNKQMPFTTSYNCWSGYFVSLFRNWQTLGELTVTQAGRGSVADLSPTGLHLGSALQVLNQGIVVAIFRDRIRTVGDAVDAAKLYYFTNTSAWHDVIDTSVLFGDPATRLRLPAMLPTAPAVSITATAPIMAADARATLHWPHQLDSAQYEIWRDTTPYFDPAADQGVQVTTRDAGLVGRGASFTFGDDGKTSAPAVKIIGNTAVNYYWVLRSRNGDGVSTLSNRVGEFDFALVPGE